MWCTETARVVGANSTTNSTAVSGPCADPLLSAKLDTAIAIFILNLEYLEATYFSFAAYGVPIPECAATVIGETHVPDMVASAEHTVIVPN